MDANLITTLKNCVELSAEQEPLSRHTTVQVGGPAALMVFPTDARELSSIFRTLRESEKPCELRLLGGGGNCFADSEGFDGLVINMRWMDRLISISTMGRLTALGGASLRDLAVEAARHGLGGVDFMAVVPGTLGGAVAINAGTHTEGFVADRFLYADTLDLAGERRRYEREEMQFGYRTSRLLYGREVVLRADFQLTPCSALGHTSESLLQSFEAMMEERKRKFPLDLPNFGSTFRSPGRKLPPAGQMIDELGMKGLRAGDAQISEKHGNFIVNLGAARSSDVLELMQRMHNAVRDRYGVRLRPEVHYLANADRPRPDFFPAAERDAVH